MTILEYIEVNVLPTIAYYCLLTVVGFFFLFAVALLLFMLFMFIRACVKYRGNVFNVLARRMRGDNT